MSRALSRSRSIVVLLLLGLPLLLAGCPFNSLQPATLAMIDDAEAAWLASPTASYRITVEIERPDDLRRSVVTVVDHQIVEGAVFYWDYDARRWQEPMALNQEQAFPFSVPGLFEMVRGALEESGRDEIRVLLAGDSPFPQKIVLGPVLVDGEPFSQTKATVTVSRYDPE